jgi:hypothetical protein
MFQTEEIDTTVGSTILQQMGGHRRITVMTGAKDYQLSGNSVSFRFPNRRPSKGNHVRVALDQNDTYTVEFSKRNKNGLTPVSVSYGIYADQLIAVFEKQTGLYLHF